MLHRQGLLRELFTDIWCRYGRSLLKRGPAPARALAGRYHPFLSDAKVTGFSLPMTLNGLRKRPAPGREALYLHYFENGRTFAKHMLRAIEPQRYTPGVDRFFGFNTGCLEALPLLKERGVFTVVDQIDPARVEEELIFEEVERWPGWQSSPGKIPEVYFERLDAEWSMADRVLVNSAWTSRALQQQGVPASKILIAPIYFKPPANITIRPAANDRLRVLWLGSVNLRKGIPYLIEAAKRLAHTDIEFIVAGPIDIAETAVAGAPSNMKFVGRVTRDQTAEMYRSCDVFVLPTISDGFAITQIEAMAYGLPVITTPNCGEVVEEGKNGYVIPIRDPVSLAEAIEKLNDDRPLLESMRQSALKRVADFDPMRVPSPLEPAAQAAIEEDARQQHQAT